ncbi:MULTISPECIES: TIGR04104 family putative zinc finger protein [Alteribacter]|uniref:TIGR04104 family putative zinc finger protein n=1 Tax=Alteribacter TaxID=2823237 RepID=UPI001606A04F|nr:TIGR04104 family putative zinc finger protein [Alteribacter keqinensis]MBM7097650.1 hypothetical protein [Alteribacter salitolerans]
MKLPRCWSCDYSFLWKELLVTGFRIKCPNCEKEQFVTAKARKRSGVFGPLVVVLMFVLMNGFSLNVWQSLLAGVVLLAVILSFSPFAYDFTDKDEPLF